MSKVNKCIFIGRVGKEPVVKTSQSGNDYVQFSLCVQSGYGENLKDNWLNFSVFGKMVNPFVGIVHKGSLLYVEGEISIQKNNDKYYTGFVLNSFQVLESKQEPNGNQAPKNHIGGEDFF